MNSIPSGRIQLRHDWAIRLAIAIVCHASCRYHNSRFYGVQSSAMVKANSSHLAMQTSKNIGIITLASADPRKHFANIQVRCSASEGL